MLTSVHVDELFWRYGPFAYVKLMGSRKRYILLLFKQM